MVPGGIDELDAARLVKSDAVEWRDPRARHSVPKDPVGERPTRSVAPSFDVRFHPCQLLVADSGSGAHGRLQQAVMMPGCGGVCVRS